MRDGLKTLFHELADLSPAEREGYYAKRRVPRALRNDLESLLTFDTINGESIRDLVGSAAEQLLRSGSPVPEDGRCGPYRLVRLLGNGGMGAVYLAERADGEVKQQVAIKFLKPGAHLPSFRERFLRERQILATLNHPGIARLLDVGHTGGQPYLVMEYVAETCIDQYAGGLDTRGILMLFREVCEAVSYAHRNLIIHRDLKPSNILIDSSGRPKLLDFGIAKILDAPDETQTIDRMLTPEYASPEQRHGGVQATTTDIYSLGAVLYRLLTGESPQTSGGPAYQRLAKDLKHLLNKAMRKEPEERYASVDAFSEDVRAYLEHRPVRARRGKAWYLTRMFLRRYWLPAGCAGLAIVGLAGGLIAAERQQAVAERRFQEVRRLSNQFFELDADIRSLPGATKARHHIVSASLEYLERLGAEGRPGGWFSRKQQDLLLAMEIAAAYLQVARVQGVPGNSDLGQFAQARQSLSKADAFVEPVLRAATFPRQQEAMLLSAEIADDEMVLAATERRIADTLELDRKTAERLEALFAMGSPKTETANTMARLYANVALSYSNVHHLDEAARYAQRAVDTARISHDDKQLGRGLGILANTARFSGDLERALAAIRESRKIAEKFANRDDISQTLALAGAIWREGLILGELNNINLDRPQEATPLLQKAFDLSEDLASRDAHDYASRSYVGMTGRELGDVLRDGKPAAALAIYDRSRKRVAEIQNNSKARRDEVWLLAGSSYALRRLHRTAESRRRIDAALEIVHGLNGSAPGLDLGEEGEAALHALADHYAGTGNHTAAIATYQELLKKVQATNPQPGTDLRHANGLSRIYQDLANVYRRTNQPAEAGALDQRRLALWQFWDRKLPNNPFVRRQLQAAQPGQGRETGPNGQNDTLGS